MPTLPRRARHPGELEHGGGKGHLATLLEQLQDQDPSSDVIVLLQEAYRSETPPGACPPGRARVQRRYCAAAIARQRGHHVPRRTGMYTVYAPSMRNSDATAPLHRAKIAATRFSTLPLSDAVIIELPFSQQRRVAVAARVRVGDRDVGLVSMTFSDTRHGHKAAATAIIQSVALLRAVQSRDWRRFQLVSAIGRRRT